MPDLVLKHSKEFTFQKWTFAFSLGRPRILLRAKDPIHSGRYNTSFTGRQTLQLPNQPSDLAQEGNALFPGCRGRYSNIPIARERSDGASSRSRPSRPAAKGFSKAPLIESPSAQETGRKNGVDLYQAVRTVRSSSHTSSAFRLQPDCVQWTFEILAGVLWAVTKTALALVGFSQIAVQFASRRKHVWRGKIKDHR